MGKPSTLNHDVEYNRNLESDISPFMQAEWEGRAAYLENGTALDCPYKDIHFKNRWLEGFRHEALEFHDAVYSLEMQRKRLGKGKKP